MDASTTTKPMPSGASVDNRFVLAGSGRTIVPLRDEQKCYAGSVSLERGGVLTFSLHSPRPVRIWIGRYLAVDDAPQRDRSHIFRRLRLAVSLPLPAGEHPVVIEIGARSRHIYWLDVQNTSYYRDEVLAAIMRRIPDELTFAVRVVPDAVGPAVCVRFEPGQFRHDGCVWQDLWVRRIAGFGPIYQPWSLEEPGQPVSWSPQLSSAASPGKSRPVACWENRPANETRVYVPVTSNGEEPPVARAVGRDERPETERTVVGEVQLTVKDPSGEVTQRIQGDASGNVVGTAGINFEHLVTKTTKLLDKLMVESGSSNTSVSNDFAVQVSMTDKLALAFGYGVRYNTDPAPGTKRLDQLTTVNIVYNIK